MKILVAGSARGTILQSDEPINFLGMVDKNTGIITDDRHPLHGVRMAGRILAFPSGVGSSVGAYTIYSIKSRGVAPAAMLCEKADSTVVSGCALAGIPLAIVSPNERRALPNGQDMVFGADMLSIDHSE